MKKIGLEQPKPSPQHSPRHQPPSDQGKLPKPFAQLLTGNMVRSVRIFIPKVPAAELLIDSKAQSLLNESKSLERILAQFIDDLLDRLAARVRC